MADSRGFAVSSRTGSQQKKLRFARMVKRQRFLCAICGERFGTGSLRPTIDHRIPLAQGGKNHRGNVQAAHQRCNREKGDALGFEHEANRER